MLPLGSGIENSQPGINASFYIINLINSLLFLRELRKNKARFYWTECHVIDRGARMRAVLV